MTNLVAFIFFTVTTGDWRTVSTTIPALEQGNVALAVYRPPIANQVGNVWSNTMARIVWNNKTNEVAIESTLIGNASRSVDANTVR